MMNRIPADVQHTLDYGAVGIFGATLLELLPSVTALLTAVWLALRVYILLRDIFTDEKIRRKIAKEKPPLDK